MSHLAIVATNSRPLSPYSAQFTHDIRNAWASETRWAASMTRASPAW